MVETIHKSVINQLLKNNSFYLKEQGNCSFFFSLFCGLFLLLFHKYKLHITLLPEYSSCWHHYPVSLSVRRRHFKDFLIMVIIALFPKLNMCICAILTSVKYISCVIFPGSLYNILLTQRLVCSAFFLNFYHLINQQVFAQCFHYAQQVSRNKKNYLLK